MGDGPVVGAQCGAAGCPHSPLVLQGTGVKWVDDRKVLSGIIPVIQKGLRWVDAPAAQTLYNRFRMPRARGADD